MGKYADIIIFKCPFCGKTCEIMKPCDCKERTNFNIMEERKGKGVICVGYTDKDGNKRRFR